MSLPQQVHRRQVWRGALVAAWLNPLGMILDGVLGRSVPGMPWWPNAMSAAIGGVLVLVLILRRRPATAAFASTVFMVNNAAILLALWISSGHYVTAGVVWTPFQANKLGVMVVALLAPGLVAGLASIIAFAAMAVARFYTLDPLIQGRFPIGEPWLILIYAVFGGVLLAYRLRGLALEREAMRLHWQAAVADRVARTVLAIHDYANTPLQTVELTTGLLRRRNPALGPQLDRMNRALARLRGLGRAFSRHESELGESSDESSDLHRFRAPGPAEDDR